MWELKGIDSIKDKTGKGRKRIYTNEEEKIILSIIDEIPRDLNQVLLKVCNEINKPSSKETLKRILNRNDYSWKKNKKCT